jgi:ribosomal protein L16 Arg81 hydroxylase
MEEALGAKMQANLYLSSKRKQGFKVHFDPHDVFAVHVMGEKTWMVFDGRAEDPIAHPVFNDLPAEHHEAAKGKLWKEVRLKPGHLLYLPRGQYHYALADEEPCAHIAWGATYPIGLDAVTYLFERLVHEPVARANLARGDRARLGAQLRKIGERAAAPARRRDDAGRDGGLPGRLPLPARHLRPARPDRARRRW